MTAFDLLRFEDWTNPVPPADREVVSLLPEEDDGRPPLLFVPGLGHGAWAFAEHWLPHAAGRGFPAHALTPRPGGDLRAQVHDVVQTAASLPRQAVLIGHGVGALVVARALGRYPARAAVLAAPVLGGWSALGSALRANPGGTLPALVGGRLSLSARQLFQSGPPALTAEQITGYLSRLDPKPRAELLRRATPPRPVGDAPVLVIGSPDDRVVARPALDRAAAAYSGAPLMFPGMGHDLMLEASWAEPIDAILDWLTKQIK
ncbi:alpha/beta hydrolase [Actinoplanes cyaneus]|uniref:Alpha/beta hydrolase n=1 Tax=Actinoplanes cyaneus TaxID=52696 RepID=A0A919M292_9ACTN|nr:alpha/beta fold hydrolase [Actinoplanes cyaneus]MCW2137181.1 Lysophospholipase, alpha-beta hydrolase superfamily [Actinoplanes cyaneus]GID63232.1 alpha/beta hydrolase [Actinoplanes cyaneus]